MRSLAWDFNRELVVGEFGALGVANLTALVAARYTQSAAVISAAAIPGTLLGGSLFWLTARVYDQVTGQRFAAKSLASDIAWFTPAAIASAAPGRRSKTKSRGTRTRGWRCRGSRDTV